MEKPPNIGKGIYGISEAARYTRQSPSRIRSWFVPRGDAKSDPIFEPDYGRGEDNLVLSFLDLIDVLIAGQLRQLNIPMPAIRSAFAGLGQRMGTRHAFSHRCLRDQGPEVFSGIADARAFAPWVARPSFPDGLGRYLQQIDYDDASGLAKTWHIAEGVVVNPKICFGKPSVQHTNITTYVLRNQFYANHKNEKLIMYLYKVSPRDIRNAVAFEDEMQVRGAA